MSRTPKKKRQPSPLPSSFQGFKYFQLLDDLLLKFCPSSNRRSFTFVHYVSLLLFYFFNPVVKSLRALQDATHLPELRKKLKIPYVSLGQLSAASSTFDPYCILQVIHELAGHISHAFLPKDLSALSSLVAVDGSLLPALPRMIWALWQNQSTRAAKLYLHFEVARGIPLQATITAGQESEVEQLRNTLQPGRLYVLDRGYAAYSLLRQILDTSSSFIVRVKQSIAFTPAKERTLAETSKQAGILRDVEISQLGSTHRTQEITRPLRLVVAEVFRERTEKRELIVLVTSEMEMDADLILLGYKYRWQVELFFRWMKSIMGCRHWISESQNGLQLQVYISLLASMLMTAWLGRKATKRTFELLQFYLMGWASIEDVQRHVDALPVHPLAPTSALDSG